MYSTLLEDLKENRPAVIGVAAFIQRGLELERIQ